jgi:hypothetical protein
VNLRLINADEEGLAVGDFAWEQLKIGDAVKVLAPIREDTKHHAAIWVRVTKIVRHPHPEYNLVTGTLEEVADLGDTGRVPGQIITFGRCNIVQIA